MSDTYSDPLGTGAPEIMEVSDPSAPPSMLSADYYRQKITEFQGALNELEPVYFDLQALASFASIAGDDDGYSQAMALIEEFESKRDSFITTANAINLASDGVNALGIQMPRVNVPGLGALPFIPIAIGGAAIAGVIALLAWIRYFTDRVAQLIERWKSLDTISTLPEEDRAAAFALFEQTQVDVAKAQAAANQSTVSQIAQSVQTLVKWGAIGLVLWIGYKAYKESK